MSNYIESPYMTLSLPIPGLATGTGYATAIDDAFLVVDSHTHIAGQGLPVPTLGLNINADLTFNSYNAIMLRSSRYDNQISALALVTDINCIYVKAGELYYNDALGNQVQITLSGSVDVSGSGNITGMGGTTASVVYTNINKTFSFYSDTATPAPLLIGPLSIGTNTASPFPVTLTTSGTITVPYTYTFADTLPAAQALMSADNAGLIQHVAPDDVTVTIVGNILSALFPSGMIIATGSNSIPTGWLFCNGQLVSRSTYSTLFTAIGIAYGSGNGTTTFAVPDFRGMFLRGVSGPTGVDPDASSRVISNTGGNTGNNVGSLQASTFTSHTHIQNSHTHTQDAHTHTQNSHNHTQDAHVHDVIMNNISSTTPGTNSVQGSVESTTVDRGLITGTTATNQAATATNQNATDKNQATVAVNQNSGGSTETRPVNIYVNYLIKT